MKDVTYWKILDDYDNERVRIRIRTEKGKVVDMIVQYESMINNKWTPIIRYDCYHGFFHRDVLLPNGEKEKYSLPMSSMEDALNYAEQDIKDRWEFYKERYLKKLKK